MKKSAIPFLNLIFMALPLISVGCNEVRFENIASSPQKLVDPVVPPTLPEIPFVDAPAHKTGVCSTDQKISSCLQCPGLSIPTPPPPPLTKAAKLADIISRGCLIPNSSDPINKIIPSKQEILNRLQSCTSEIYPETSLTTSEKQTIEDLLDPANVSFQNKIFKGLYYQPPFTDHFETYFGIETQAARQLLCFNTGSIAGDLITSEYASECLYSDDNCAAFKSDKVKYSRWLAANQIRKELQSCLDKPYNSPVAQPAPPPAKQCQIESFEGHISQGGVELLYHLVQNGYTISVETDDQCQVVNNVTDNFLENLSRVRITGYKCNE